MNEEEVEEGNDKMLPSITRVNMAYVSFNQHNNNLFSLIFSDIYISFERVIKIKTFCHLFSFF